ncbi:MAG: zeta toxin family protein [Candidatus Saccharimonadales bacterium]
MEEVADSCFRAITSQRKRPLFVAVTGDSGSGKSYLVSLLQAKLEEAHLAYTLINHDEFLISRVDREPMKSIYYTDGKYVRKSHWEVLENMFRLAEFERVISELRAGKEASFHPYSRETGSVMDTARTVLPNDFIIFDTSMMLDKMDFVILVDVTQENIIKRKLARDSDIRTPEQITEMHKQVQGYYWEDRGRPAHPDIIIDNNDFSNVKIIQSNELSHYPKT